MGWQQLHQPTAGTPEAPAEGDHLHVALAAHVLRLHQGPVHHRHAHGHLLLARDPQGNEASYMA